MDSSRLKRAVNPMPEDIRQRMEAEKVFAVYRFRPAYQQNDYIGWINRAKRPETREKRIAQMIAELKTGDSYMGMDYHSKK
ncbi:Hypothetical protein Tpal_1535 [Trichococcus palustris]|uniref:Bacteriocin-protection, YdeI or OmpD-Associated n=1 Tax=Trichococcus palustris TaxID=140314 RepID=A0A143YMR5_9LACT|nr:YdeI/OmpD-associated family protein [Trichococcus palustris]CZQ92733.1 Hypothetical protein Tpal_1535 [Trichococcus palustris]SFL06010.1 Bacteriocin-protection, YdeI or OmpD-Associated [Trichococcus palustris]